MGVLGVHSCPHLVHLHMRSQRPHRGHTFMYGARSVGSLTGDHTRQSAHHTTILPFISPPSASARTPT